MGGISTGGSDRRAAEWFPVLPLVNGLGSKSQEKQSMIKAAQELYLLLFSPGCFQGSLRLTHAQRHPEQLGADGRSGIRI